MDNPNHLKESIGEVLTTLGHDPEFIRTCVVVNNDVESRYEFHYGVLKTSINKPSFEDLYVSDDPIKSYIYRSLDTVVKSLQDEELMLSGLDEQLHLYLTGRFKGFVFKIPPNYRGKEIRVATDKRITSIRTSPIVEYDLIFGNIKAAVFGVVHPPGSIVLYVGGVNDMLEECKNG